VIVVSNSRNAYPYEPNVHPELEFHLIRHGNSRYSVDGVNYSCAKNSIIYIHADEPHTWVFDRDTADKNMTLVFDPKVLSTRTVSKTALEGLEPFHHLELPDEQAGVAEFLLNEISDECKHKDLHWQELVVEYVENFLAVLFRAAEGHVSAVESTDILVKEITDYLERKYMEKISLGDMAKRLNMSSFALSKKFKQQVGTGFREYLIHRRIVAAQKMLEETDLKVATIATRVGFDSLTTFNRDFRILNGVTPAVYRTIWGSKTHDTEPEAS
jgi:AraC-like DNA-binding protein